MNKKETFEFMNKNPGFHLATVDKDVPRVRGMLLFRADENGIIFHTSAVKDVYKQISVNPNVELCFNDLQSGGQVRVSGKLETVDDTKLKDEIVTHPSRGFLQMVIKSMPSKEAFFESFKVFNLKCGKAVVWTMQTNMGPKEYINL